MLHQLARSLAALLARLGRLVALHPGVVAVGLRRAPRRSADRPAP